MNKSHIPISCPKCFSYVQSNHYTSFNHRYYCECGFVNFSFEINQGIENFAAVFTTIDNVDFRYIDDPGEEGISITAKNADPKDPIENIVSIKLNTWEEFIEKCQVLLKSVLFI